MMYKARWVTGGDDLDTQASILIFLYNIRYIFDSVHYFHVWFLIFNLSSITQLHHFHQVITIHISRELYNFITLYKSRHQLHFNFAVGRGYVYILSRPQNG